MDSNYSRDAQAISRITRVDQKKVIKIIQLYSDGGLEEGMKVKAEMRKDTQERVLNRTQPL